jgi:PhnB protein
MPTHFVPEGQHSISPFFVVKDVPALIRFLEDAFDAKELSRNSTHFYGDRSAGILDPAGNTWWIGTHEEDVSHEEIQKRLSEKSR